MRNLVEYLRDLFRPPRTHTTVTHTTVTVTSESERQAVQRRLADQRRALELADAQVDATRAAKR